MPQQGPSSPHNSFYEWKKTGTGKQPHAVSLADRSLMALAGLWENWRSPAGEWVRSFAIVTTTPNALCAELHNRNAGGPEAGNLASLAGGGACGCVLAQGHARAVSIGRDDLLARERESRKRQK
jgi:hypothetical protein